MSAIATEKFGNVLVAHTPDELTEETRAQFLDAFSPSTLEDTPNVVLQMDRTEAYDSEGLETLLELEDRVVGQGGRLRISGLVEPGRTIFNVTRLDKQFDIYESIIEAVSSFE